MEAVVLYLNRDCPRKCNFCDIRNTHKNVLPNSEILRILEFCAKEFDNPFFLFLGNEPLLLGDKLVDLVSKIKNYTYGLYSTSPEPWFSKYREALVKAELKNWSSGIDFIPEVYEKVKDNLSPEAKRLIEIASDIRKKSIEGLNGQMWMYEQGVEVIHTLITISRMNVEFVPEMLDYLNDNIIQDKRWKVGLNVIEDKKARNDDFASPKSSFSFTEKDKDLWDRFVEKMRERYDKYPFIQIPFEYLLNWDSVLNLNVRWGSECCSLCFDCDGSVRQCGYRNAPLTIPYTRLFFDKEEVLEEWASWVENCDGCYWALPYIIFCEKKQILDYSSDYWTRKYKYWRER